MTAIVFKTDNLVPCWIPELPEEPFMNDHSDHPMAVQYQYDYDQVIASVIPFIEVDRGRILQLWVKTDNSGSVNLPTQDTPYPIEGLEVALEDCRSCVGSGIVGRGWGPKSCDTCLGTGKLVALKEKKEEDFDKTFEAEMEKYGGVDAYLRAHGEDPEKLAEHGVTFANNVIKLIKAEQEIEALKKEREEMHSTFNEIQSYTDKKVKTLQAEIEALRERWKLLRTKIEDSLARYERINNTRAHARFRECHTIIEWMDELERKTVSP